MKMRGVQLYLLFVGITLAVTALAKLPAIFPPLTLCMEDPILTQYQMGLSNKALLAVAASVEMVIVGLICFSPWRWVPCLAAALWGTLCIFIRFYLLDPTADCECLGWLGKPGPTTNLVAGLLALIIATGGWISLWMTGAMPLVKKNCPIPAAD